MPDTAAAPERSLSVDGGKIADWEYYDLLGVQGNATDAGQCVPCGYGPELRSLL